MTEIVELKNDESIQNFIRNNDLVVVFYGSKSCGHCIEAMRKYPQYPQMFPNIKFCHVEINREVRNNNPTIKQHTHNGVPAFIYYVQGEQVGKSLGAKFSQIENQLRSMNVSNLSNVEMAKNKDKITELKNDREIQNFSTNKKKSVIFYGNKNCGHCMKMSGLYPTYANTFPSISFAHVETSEIQSNMIKSVISSGVPVFLIFLDGEFQAKVIGADTERLTKLLTALV